VEANPPPGAGDARGGPVGLCASCRWARRSHNARGSAFWRCERARTDPRLRRYPALPVLACPGFESPPDPAAAR
jgi:hypothetical protein